MGRSSAPVLQAVCLAGWLTERQADAYVITAKRQDIEAASAGQFVSLHGLRAFHYLRLYFIKSIGVTGLERVGEITSPTNDRSATIVCNLNIIGSRRAPRALEV